MQKHLAHRASATQPCAKHKVPHNSNGIAAKQPRRHRHGVFSGRHHRGQPPHQRRESHQHHRKVHQCRKAAAGHAHLFALAVGPRVHLLARGQQPHRQWGQRISQQPATRIGDQVVHIRQTIGPRIIPVKARKLRQLKKQTEQKGKQQRLFQAASEIIPQVDSQRRKHGHIGHDLEEIPVPHQAVPRGRPARVHAGVVQQVRHLPEGNQLHARGGQPADRFHIRQRQDHQKIGAHQVQHKRIHDRRAQKQHRPVPAVLKQHIGQREHQRHKGKQHQRRFDRLDVLAHGKLLTFQIWAAPPSGAHTPQSPDRTRRRRQGRAAGIPGGCRYTRRPRAPPDQNALPPQIPARRV